MSEDPKVEEKPADENEKFSQIGPWKFRLRLLRYNQPLWLPKGSVRALITLTVISTAMYCFVRDVAIDETFKMLISTVIAFYFGSRLNFSDEKKADGQ